MTMAIALDLLVAGLLVATIAYAIVLNRRLSQLRGGSEQMERMIADFYQATTHAEASLTALKDLTGRNEGDIAGQLNSLTGVRDELEFLVSRAESEGARLEALIREGRDRPGRKSSGAAAGLAPDSGLDAELFGAPAGAQELR